MILKLFTRKKLKPINNYNINAFYKITVFIYCFTGTFLKQIWFLACEKQFRRVYLQHIFKLPYT